TSESQCLLFIILKTPVAVATPYPAIPYQIETSLYSCHKNSAPINAVAVCPDGKELYVLPSGRCTLVTAFKLKTLVPMIRYEVARIMVRSLKLCFPLIPTALRP